MDPEMIVQGLTIVVGGLVVWLIKRSITQGAVTTAMSISGLETSVAGVKEDTKKIGIHLATMNGRIGTVESNLENHKEYTKDKFQWVHGRIKAVEEDVDSLLKK
ncbi:MAG: hypothetical protein ABGX83_05525 [Nitrospira sp.]